jgi:excisionase family DNA binding protein
MFSIDAALRHALKDVVREVFREELQRMESVSAPAADTSGGYLTAQQAAQYAQVERDTIYEWVSKGKLRARRAGNRLRIMQNDVERFLSADESSTDLVTDDDFERKALSLIG